MKTFKSIYEWHKNLYGKNMIQDDEINYYNNININNRLLPPEIKSEFKVIIYSNPKFK